MITDHILHNELNTGACAPQMPRPDDRYSRNLKKDLISCIEKWFDFVAELKGENIHPEAVYALMRFIKTDLNS